MNTISIIERKVYVCPVHGEVLGVVGMGKDRAPLHAFCGQKVEVVRLVPDTQLREATEALKAIRDHGKVEGHECWALHQGDCAEVFQEIARHTLDRLGGSSEGAVSAARAELLAEITEALRLEGFTYRSYGPRAADFIERRFGGSRR